MDLAIGIVGLWLAAGFLWDSWAHLHVDIDSFFTPYHALFYSAMVVGTGALVVTAIRNRARGYSSRHLLPTPYRRALLGVPIFFFGGVVDLVWHNFFGIEDRIEAVTSPPHLVIGFGIVVVLSGPIRSALSSRSELNSLQDQLPLIFSLAAILEFVHLGTSYAFDPFAARAYAPPDGTSYSPDYFTATTLLLYKTGTGVVTVILQSLLLMGFTVWLVSRFTLKFGAITLLFLLGDGLISATLTGDTPLVAIHLCMAIVAGVVADVLVAALHPSAAPIGALRLFAFVVPIAYFATYFTLTMALQGTWWRWPLIAGTLLWGGLAGAATTFLVGSHASFDKSRDASIP